MKVDCEGCAGCCVDWRDIAPADVDLDHERRGGLLPLDDTYNLVPLSSDEIREFLDAGLGDAMTPRLFEGNKSTIEIDGYEVAAIDDRPAFGVGLRKPPKPVDPFKIEPTWLSTCVFLDPETLQCRIHNDDLYPETCRLYPRENLALEVETECERVETAFDQNRLLERDPDGAEPLLGIGALGATVFAHHDPSRLSGHIDRIASDAATPEDRAEFIGVAAASRPGALDVDQARFEKARRTVLQADSWVGQSIDIWKHRATSEQADPSMGRLVEEDRGAPQTPGWD